ncbi:hypothetical protein Tsp_05743 [Trichinella spiralis]|uniref:hypothetical protein n=1 Tax=Trichinella spiralis TaxID=6334 RepID=UPI0001EFBDE6|nr:hypothetical protein Tsp_05743 [Trichinella spiralis]
MDEEVRREKVYSALSFVLFFAFILFPLWWKTTEVYRADLPYDEIHNLSKITFQLSIFVDLVWIDLSAKSSVERIQARLEEEYNSTQISDKMLLTYKYNARKIDDDELGKFFGDGNSSNLFNVESASADLLGSVRVIFVSDQIAQLFGEEVDLFLGCHQQASLFVRVQLDEEEILRKLTQTLKGVIFNEQRLEWIVAKAFHRSVEHDESVGKLPTTLTVVNPLRNEYALELFIVEPTPSGPVHGDTNAELEMPLLDKFLSRLSLVTKVSMNSQVLYGIDFPVLPERDPRGDYFYYDSKRLPYLINPMESFMGSYVTTLPVVHLLVYLTPDVHRPLYILDPTGVGRLGWRDRGQYCRRSGGHFQAVAVRQVEQHRQPASADRSAAPVFRNRRQHNNSQSRAGLVALETPPGGAVSVAIADVGVAHVGRQYAGRVGDGRFVAAAVGAHFEYRHRRPRRRQYRRRCGPTVGQRRSFWWR